MSELRARLREATGEAHARLHLHQGFAAAASGGIAPGDYRALLARLYGFHRAFEADFAAAPTALAAAIALPGRARAPALGEDLRALGMTAGEIAALPPCPAPPARASEPQWLGGLYVTEGSTLGGASISRALAQAGFGPAQRRFFEGYGERRGAMWRRLLVRLESHVHDSAAAKAAEEAARATFEAFEVWMRDWRGGLTP